MGIETNGNTPERQKQERMPDRQIGNILSALNNEAKAAVMAGVSTLRPRGRIEISYMVNEMQGEDPGWNLIPQHVGDIWEKSLHKSGLVPQSPADVEESASGRTSLFSKGVATAGQLLAFSERHPETSLIKLTGKGDIIEGEVTPADEREKGANVTSAPLTRYRVYKVLLAHEHPLRAIDVQRTLHENYPDEYPSLENTLTSLRFHFDELSTSGLVMYKPAEKSKPTTKYAIPADEPEDSPTTYRRYRNLTLDVKEALRGASASEGDATIDAVYEELIREHPEKAEQKKKSLKGDISGILNHLTQEGHAVKTQQFRELPQSSLSLTPEQRELLTDYVGVVDKLSSGDPVFLVQGRRIAEEIISDPTRISKLLAKAKADSPHANRTSQEQTTEEVASFLQQFPDSDNRQIQSALRTRGHRLSIQSIRSITSRMEGNDSVNVTVEGNTKKYAMKPEVRDSNEGTVIFQMSDQEKE